MCRFRCWLLCGSYQGVDSGLLVIDVPLELGQCSILTLNLRTQDRDTSNEDTRKQCDRRPQFYMTLVLMLVLRLVLTLMLTSRHFKFARNQAVVLFHAGVMWLDLHVVHACGTADLSELEC